MSKVRRVKIGNCFIGDGEKIAVQSMTTAYTADVEKTVEQIRALEARGCDIVRVAVPDEASAKAIYDIKNNIAIPLVADIHFDYRLALTAMERGVDKIRINPGNIGGEDRARAVADEARRRGIPIRIGVNGGSLEKHLLEKYGSATPEAMVESAAEHVRILEKYNFFDTVISIKSSDVKRTIDAYRLARERFNYPLHLGVTEAGTYEGGLIKSAIGIGSLLADGIGETIRVSLTDDPVREVDAARRILRALGLLKGNICVVSCPTCARCRINLIPIAQEVTRRLENLQGDLKVAVMGCAVNGPGEAKDADIGIAGGNGEALLFKKGEIVGKIPEDRIVETLMQEIEKMKGTD
ncbi:MAG: flavodoxin-dependent (E)-4-hydroxy-3-methylbut-2-enyl-diphosphate synthase [Clostridia bacterium]|nr:flavodoxin-dependent (E)-4-hydroxy-3-methylbut-2-enyl-diphosphate synthase [Clostridia bacterium]MBQ9737810.1 flavodoxin-dependent (E)-4-hydroxy-3-methylbut-2-enyl-diphosphate synthase [Clostridia bacterium]